MSVSYNRHVAGNASSVPHVSPVSRCRCLEAADAVQGQHFKQRFCYDLSHSSAKSTWQPLLREGCWADLLLGGGTPSTVIIMVRETKAKKAAKKRAHAQRVAQASLVYTPLLRPWSSLGSESTLTA